MYTVTDLVKVEKFPPIIVSPAYCVDTIVYSLGDDPLNTYLGQAIQFEGLDEIKILQTSSLDILGEPGPGYPQSNVYALIYKATVGRGDTRLAIQAETTLTFLNPCYDPDFVNIVSIDAP